MNASRNRHFDNDRRRHPRVRLSVDVDFKSQHNFFSARTRDISRGGLFIETNIRIPIGERIEIDLRFLKTRVLVDAEVVWEMVGEDGETEGLGVRFLGLPESIADRIEAFMGIRSELRIGEVEESGTDGVEQDASDSKSQLD